MKKLPAVVGLLVLLFVPLVADAQPLRPDLVISGNIAVSTTRVGVGETYEYVVTAKNIGDAPCNRVTLSILTSPGSDFVRAVGEPPLRCDRMLCEGGPFFFLWPGQSISARYIMKARDVGLQGPATGVVDPNNACKEASETNNTATSPQVQIIERPQLNIVVHPVSRRRSGLVDGINAPMQIFPVTITNVGRGVATDVAVAWSIGNAGLGPSLVSAYFGPRVAPDSPMPPPLNVRCPPLNDPATTVCTIEVRLGPGETIQGDFRFASCRFRGLNATIHVSTADEIVTVDHSVALHRGCS